MLFRQIVDSHLAQNAYLIGCQRTGEAVLIDPERDIDRYLEMAATEGLRITAVTETHIHADYLSGTRELAHRTGAQVFLSDEGDADWKYAWPELESPSNGGAGAFSVTLLRDGDTFLVGNIELRTVHTPGHTPEHVSFLVIDRGSGAEEPMGMATGDFVFVGDLGRPDLLESAAGVEGAMEPSARSLYRSVENFLELPDHLQIWPAHGAGSACGKALGAVPTSTVGYEKRFNPSIEAARRGENAFVAAILEGQPEPPLYFGRMKRLNQSGPPILGALPQPERPEPAEIARLAERPDVVIVDTRPDRQAFMRGHLKGSIYAPMNKAFNSIVGSYVEPEQQIVLLIDERLVDQAVRDLIRIGLDQIVAWAPLDELDAIHEAGASISATEIVSFESVAADLAERRPGSVVLDVRRGAEFAAGSVEGALNIAHTRLAERANEIPESADRVFVHCLSGARAAAASSYLDRIGVPVVYVDDAFANWQARFAGSTPRMSETPAERTA